MCQEVSCVIDYYTESCLRQVGTKKFDAFIFSVGITHCSEFHRLAVLWMFGLGLVELMVHCWRFPISCQLKKDWQTFSFRTICRVGIDTRHDMRYRCFMLPSKNSNSSCNMMWPSRCLRQINEKSFNPLPTLADLLPSFIKFLCCDLLCWLSSN